MPHSLFFTRGQAVPWNSPYGSRVLPRLLLLFDVGNCTDLPTHLHSTRSIGSAFVTNFIICKSRHFLEKLSFVTIFIIKAADYDWPTGREFSRVL